jgi:precorrin-2 dehydrogenase / sirohydrochlorin ferrochelatase
MSKSKDDFPEVKGGGSLILAWQVKNKHVLVVGGGEVSSDNLCVSNNMTRL